MHVHKVNANSEGIPISLMQCQCAYLLAYSASVRMY